MKKVVVTSVVVVVGIVLLGVLASLFGNVGVRRVQNTGGIVLSVSEPIVPGVPIRVRWETAADVPPQQVNLILRTETSNESLGIANIQDQTASVVIPCIDTYDVASISLISSISGEVLASTTADILPAGPDCF